jgi:hypothetical protein
MKRALNMIGQILVLVGQLLVVPNMPWAAEDKCVYHMICACFSLTLGIIALNIPTSDGTF